MQPLKGSGSAAGNAQSGALGNLKSERARKREKAGSRYASGTTHLHGDLTTCKRKAQQPDRVADTRPARSTYRALSSERMEREKGEQRNNAEQEKICK